MSCSEFSFRCLCDCVKVCNYNNKLNELPSTHSLLWEGIKTVAPPPSHTHTGRQMFERDMTLALSDAKFFADNEDDVGGEPRRQEEEVEVDESLFEDLEDLALDNDS